MTYKIYKYLDKRSTTKDGAHPIKIAIGFDRKVDYVSTNCYCQGTDWEALNSARCPKIHIHTKSEVDEVLRLVEQYLPIVKPYGIKQLRKLVYGALNATRVAQTISTPKTANVWDWYDLKITELKANEALGSAEMYEASMSFYKKYTSNEPVDFSFFTKSKLHEIEKLYISLTGKTRTVVHKYARHLRAIFNMAIEEKAIDREIYPFSKRGYLIGKAPKAQKAVDKEHLETLLSYNPVNASEQMALDYFLFSFHGNGMNMKDVAYLTWANVHEHVIQFYRKKTERTNSEPVLITVYITDEMRDVILRQACPSTSKHLFPILPDTSDIALERKSYKNHNWVVNSWLKKITVSLGMNIKITHGMSRHTFSNALKQSGVSTSYISEALGHSSEAVTKHYLSAFGDEIVASHSQLVRQYTKGNK